MGKFGQEIIKDLKAVVECDHDWRRSMQACIPVRKGMPEYQYCDKCRVTRTVYIGQPVPDPTPVTP